VALVAGVPRDGDRRAVRQGVPGNLQGSEMALEDGLRFEQNAFWHTMRSEESGRLMRAYLKSNRRLDQV